MKTLIQETKELVKDWHIAFNINPPTTIEEAKEFVILRTMLYEEERLEYEQETMHFDITKKVLVAKADAIGDMLVIACGTVDLIERSPKHISKEVVQNAGNLINSWFEKIESLLNITKNQVIKDNIKLVIEEIMRSNMSKLDDNGKSIINGVSIFNGTNKTIYDIKHTLGEVIQVDDKPKDKVIKSFNFIEPNLGDILFPTI